jgi:hypothetical protein
LVMSTRKRLFLSGVVLSAALISSPAAALAAAGGSDRPLTGESAGTAFVDIADNSATA